MVRTRFIAVVAAGLALSVVAFADLIVTGPEHGTLVIVGGGRVGAEILTRMFDLGGGKSAPIVVIPTASGAEDYPADWSGLRRVRSASASSAASRDLLRAGGSWCCPR